MEQIHALGRRKAAVARVYIVAGKGNVAVNGNVAASCSEINASYSCFTSSKGVCLFHLLCLNFVQLNCCRVLCLVGMLRTCINVQVAEDLVAKAGLGEHTLDCSPYKLCGLLVEDLLGSGETLASGESGIARVHLSLIHI